MSNKNHIDRWKKLYILMTYTLPHIRYGCNKLYISHGDIQKMENNTYYKKLKNKYT